jgi:hypothetical protein
MVDFYVLAQPKVARVRQWMGIASKAFGASSEDAGIIVLTIGSGDKMPVDLDLHERVQ